MKRAFTVFCILAALAVLAGAGFRLWSNRPDRTAVQVNGAVLTARELEQRTMSRYEDAVKYDHLIVPEARKGEVLAHHRLQAARAWLTRALLVDAAMAAGMQVTPQEEAAQYKTQDAFLQRHRRMSLEDYFKTGPVPEARKRRDFREGVLAAKYQRAELAKASAPTAAEIETCLEAIRRWNVTHTKAGEEPTVKADRATAERQVRAEKQRAAAYALLCGLYGKALVRAPLVPELATCEGAFPADGAAAR